MAARTRICHPRGSSSLALETSLSPASETRLTQREPYLFPFDGSVWGSLPPVQMQHYGSARILAMLMVGVGGGDSNIWASCAFCSTAGSTDIKTDPRTTVSTFVIYSDHQRWGMVVVPRRHVLSGTAL